MLCIHSTCFFFLPDPWVDWLSQPPLREDGARRTEISPASGWAPHLCLGPPGPLRPLSVLGHFTEADTTGGTQTPRPTSHRGTAGALEIRSLKVPSALEAETGREPVCPGLSTRHPRPARGLYGSRRYLWEMIWTFTEQKTPILEYTVAVRHA